MNALARHRWVGLLALGGLFAACGGRADKDEVSPSHGGSNSAGAGMHSGGAGAGGRSSSGTAGTASGGRAPSQAGEGGIEAFAGDGGAPGAAGVTGGAAGVDGGAGAGGQELGGGGATAETPSVTVLAGNYDVYLAAPPAVVGCAVAWYEPRINLAVYLTDAGKLEALPFKDFFWQGNFAEEPEVSPSTFKLAALLDWANAPATPALELSWDEAGFLGAGTAEIPYTCEGGPVTTRVVAATLEADHTSPKLRVDPDGYGSFGFTRFDFTFSEPVDLPHGEYDIVFREPADGEQAVELYDVDTNAPLPTVWQWSLAGPVAQAHFPDPASVEGRTVAARLSATLRDRAGNPLVPLEKTFDIAPAAVLDGELDFDQAPSAGVYGNASYHPTAEPGAPCEQGGCLVLDGPVARCYEAPHSTFAVRLASPWDTGVQIRYRVWASTSSVSPIGIGYASGCSGSFPAALNPLAQPDGSFTYASDWTTRTISPCGGPENENGFTLSLDCAEYGAPPDVRVVIERLTRVTAP
ncbi:MAG: hypothetical protein ABUL60_24495 [Myxococcales bacterium]